MYYFGVDEAGRGPVFGSMYIACIAAKPTDLSADIADSKTLTNKKISQLATDLVENKDVYSTVVEVDAEEIDSSEKSISELTMLAFAEAISETKFATIGAVDACLKDTTEVENQVSEFLHQKAFISAEHKADEKYPIVSAASILAKNEREKHIENLQENYGAIGSGYPSDPTTKEYLENYINEHRRLPPFARESWKTSQKALEKADVN